MLAHSAVIAFIPSKDAHRARAFYEKKLGLRFVSDDDFAIVMDANGMMLRIVRVGDFTLCHSPSSDGRSTTSTPQSAQ